eukprot:2951842-Rhodomonas_salina.1
MKHFEYGKSQMRKEREKRLSIKKSRHPSVPWTVPSGLLSVLSKRGQGWQLVLVGVPGTF